MLKTFFFYIYLYCAEGRLGDGLKIDTGKGCLEEFQKFKCEKKWAKAKVWSGSMSPGTAQKKCFAFPKEGATRGRGDRI